MENKTHLSKLIARLDRIKAAADGAETSMPDDPSGDGTTEPKTGPQFTQYSRDKDQIETVPPDADKQPSSSMSEDHEQDNSFSSYTLSTAGSEAQSAKGEYTDRPTDPGTSMPAEAGQEKYSAANCSLEENIDVFNKCAAALIKAGQAYNMAVKQASADVARVRQYPVGTFTKMAAEEGSSPEEINEVAALESLLQDNPELLAELADLAPEDLDSLASVATDMDAAGGPAEAAPEVSPEDVALEKESFYQQEPIVQRTLVSLDDSQLKQAAANLDVLMKKAAADELTDEEVAAILAPVDESSETPTSDSKKEDDSEDDKEKEGCCKKKANYEMSATDLYKQSSPQDLYYMAMMKQAEEDQAAFESLSPEEQAMLESASDEELQDALAQSDAISENPDSLEEILSDAGDSEDAGTDAEPTSDEALNELAAAMDEQGITPEVLEEASKEASADPDLYKIAHAVTQYRKSGNYIYKPATTEKAAKMRSISHKYLSEIFPRK